MNYFFISGFPPKGMNDGLIVIYDSVTFNTKDAVKLVEPTPAEDGVVHGFFDKKWSGDSIELVFISKQYVHQNVEIKRRRLGFYHTIRMKEQTNSNLPVTHKWPVNSKEWYKKSHQLTLDAYRHAKFKNVFLKIFYWVLTIGAPILGFFLGGMAGLIVGAVVTVITISLSGFASGKLKGF